MILIGYSGHAYVALGILQAAGKIVNAYCDFSVKENNPFKLEYLGNESSPGGTERIKNEDFFIAVGDNRIRRKIFEQFAALQRYPVNAVHPAAVIDQTVLLSQRGVMVSAGVCINPLTEIKDGVICNTGCIIEHECKVGAFAHIGPGVILCGNVTIGEGSFIGAGAVIRQGIRVGANAMIGAGSVIIRNVEDGQTVIGNPSRVLIR